MSHETDQQIAEAMAALEQARQAKRVPGLEQGLMTIIDMAKARAPHAEIYEAARAALR